MSMYVYCTVYTSGCVSYRCLCMYIVQCIPLGVAMALHKKKSGKSIGKEFTIDIMEVSNLLNKPSGFIKKELRQLQWTQTAGQQ